MKTIYLDHNATSPPNKEHLSELFNKLTVCLGNPSSPHAQGREASVALTEARRFVANALGVDIAEIIFVSGGSEADNLGTVGVLKQNDVPLKNQHVITSSSEHPAIREPLENLKNTEGLKLTLLPLENAGYVSLEDFIKNLTSETTLVTLMAANNEIGTIQPVKKIGDYLHYKRWGILVNPNDKEEFDELSLKYLNPDISKETLQKIHFHVDGVQAFGKLNSNEWISPGTDSCAISAHKLGALQGIGVLFLRRGRKFKPFILGGAQEKNRRAGTENLPGIVSLGLIARDLYTPEANIKRKNMDNLRRKLFEGIQKLPHIEMNSPFENVIPNTVNFSVVGKGFKGEDLLVELDMQGVCASSGSACSSGANLPSKVILALGKTPELAKNAIRLSLSTNTTEEEIEMTLNLLKKYLAR
ncbi:aminotransferase class V-fold PLP-dependent enzyme [Silvanigrella paludirubra]|uniref:Aminotransferase class V-fold PLP-dependent enzyme n=1 Tax=Silvanigrella paludirubra TaxID=2499159 RepID=A0A6N6W0S1_9BACT|nr:cysteine desulfurase family protein [Silvanigrella paludirubra]KAB8040948.1 aminotransferase class V-fold PLP-dependent enzyme [Silvanigrella paludirubra]